VVVSLDQVTKALVVAELPEGVVVPVLGNALQFLSVRNPGAAFSFAVNMTWVFSVISAAVVVAIIVYARRIRSMWWAIVLGMLLGGALGNLSDRLFREPGFGRGHVVDFISTPWMMPAIYNVADTFICVSMVVFVLLVILGVDLDGTRTVSDKKAARDGIAVQATDGSTASDAADAGRASRTDGVTLDGPSGDGRSAEGRRHDALGHDAT
jgi:signal peptidase II